MRGWLRARRPDWQPSHPTNNIDSSVSVERMSPDREPERGWLRTIGPVLKSQMDTAWYRLFFWGRERPGAERRLRDRLSKALIQMRDWCASVGRDTNSERNHGREAGDETCSLYRRSCSELD